MFGSCEKFLDHIKTNICNGDEKQYDLLIAWLADLVQNPTKLPGTALVLQGKQGTGKSIFAKAIGAMFDPQQFLCVNDSRHLCGSFNTYLKDNIVLFADEAFTVGDKRSEAILKMLITEEHICTEQKGYDPEIVPNHTHIIMTVSPEWVAPKTIDDRRFLVMGVTDNHSYDIPYFSAIVTELNNGGYGALHEYLMGYMRKDEWIKYGKSFGEFSREGLVNAGTQIDVQSCSNKEKHDLYIIGDINTECGTCGCCEKVHGREIIIRYRVLGNDNG